MEHGSLELEDIAKIIVNEGKFVSRIEYSEMEISMYRLYGESVEIWFNACKEMVVKIVYMKGLEINPYLKHLKITTLN
ncbi:MAG: hypothetical protein M3512_08520 [Bacteroidota bacterium]|nr:hypothetical protein [Bacteroidota bacterium]